MAIEKEKVSTVSLNSCLCYSFYTCNHAFLFSVSKEIYDDDDDSAEPLLPDVLDVLSSEVMPHAAKSFPSDTQMEPPRLSSSYPIVTPVKQQNTEDDDCEESTYSYCRSGISDDFDLFNGALLRASEDEVLANVSV